MNKYVFLERGNNYRQAEGNFNVKDALEKGIYNMCFDNLNKEIFLEKIADTFVFPFKVYNVNEKLVNFVDNYFQQSSGGNLGVLLNGTRGTGKTVTAKFIANRLNLPVVIVSANFPGLTDFIAKTQHDCVFFFDEFEKTFADRRGDEETTGQNLLSIMDGVYNNEHKHVFLLTTNSLRINENFLSRPSRIRYCYTFKDALDDAVLRELIEDNLEDKSRANELIKFVNCLPLSTIDIVKSLITEMNIQKCGIEDIKDIFNIETPEYNVYYYRKRINFADPAIETYTINDFKKELALPFDERKSKGIYMDCCSLDRHTDRLEVGDEGLCYGDERIVEIDKDANIIVAMNDMYNEKYFYSISSCNLKSKTHNYSLIY